jgi:hypothetical protein
MFTAMIMKNSVFCDVTPCGSDVSEERFAPNTSVQKISELGTTLAVTSN